MQTKIRKKKKMLIFKTKFLLGHQIVLKNFIPVLSYTYFLGLLNL